MVTSVTGTKEVTRAKETLLSPQTHRQPEDIDRSAPAIIVTVSQKTRE
jgi:hypothetical protein